MSKLATAVGLVTFLIGALGLPGIRDYLPLTFEPLLNSAMGNSHTFYRMVPTQDSSIFGPLLVMGIGFAFVAIGQILHRKKSAK